MILILIQRLKFSFYFFTGRKEWIEAIQKISHNEETTQTHEPSKAREETAAKEESPDSKASRKVPPHVMSY